MDHILLTSNNLAILYETKGYLEENFDMKDMGKASFIIGIEIYRDQSQGLLELSQTTYIRSILKRFNFEGSIAQDTPISKGAMLHKDLRLKNEFERANEQCSLCHCLWKPHVC